MKITMKTVMVPGEHLTAMVKAMRKVPAFVIQKTRETVVVTHPQAGEVFRSIRTMGGVWITRHADNLFE